MTKWSEFKCFDCDQIFLMPKGPKATTCPRCSSDRIQYAGDHQIAVETDSH